MGMVGMTDCPTYEKSLASISEENTLLRLHRLHRAAVAAHRLAKDLELDLLEENHNAQLEWERARSGLLRSSQSQARFQGMPGAPVREPHGEMPGEPCRGCGATLAFYRCSGCGSAW